MIKANEMERHLDSRGTDSRALRSSLCTFYGFQRNLLAEWTATAIMAFFVEVNGDAMRRKVRPRGVREVWEWKGITWNSGFCWLKLLTGEFGT